MIRPSFIDQTAFELMLEHGRARARGANHDPVPVVKLFTPDAGAIWLLTEIDPTDYDRAFGLCDLGLGEPELGYVSLGELAAVRGPLRLPIERDLTFTGSKPISEYAVEARRARRIVA